MTAVLSRLRGGPPRHPICHVAGLGQVLGDQDPDDVFEYQHGREDEHRQTIGRELGRMPEIYFNKWLFFLKADKFTSRFFTSRLLFTSRFFVTID